VAEGATGWLCQPIPHFAPGRRAAGMVLQSRLLGCSLKQYQHISGDLVVLLGATLMVNHPSLGYDVSKYHGLARSVHIWLGISKEN